MQIPLFVLLCISMLSSPTVFSSPLSCDTTVFGFNKYVKTTNQTNTFTGSFSVSDSSNTFAIVVFNGLDGENRISRGTISINGVEVVSASDFSQNVDSFEKPVASLQAGNTIDIALQKGNVGGFIVVRVVDRGSGVTSLSGRVLSTDDRALEKVRLTIGRVNALTDRNGDFFLDSLPCGKQRLAIDASGVKGNRDYASVNELLDLTGGVLNQISRPIFLPEINLSNGVEVPNEVTSDITISNPDLPGVSLTIKAGTKVTYPDGSSSAVVTVTEVPVDKTPMSLPPELAPAVVITVQPEGVVLSQAARVVYPNLENLPPGEKVELISLSPGSGQFVGQGTATVSADGAGLVADEFSGLFSFDWHTWLPFPPDPFNPNPERQDCNCRRGVGSDAGLFDGGLIDQEMLPAHHSVGAARQVTLHYNSLAANPRPILASHTTLNAVSATPSLLSYLLEVGGVPQGAETYVDTSTLDGEVDEET